jgi:hypothetical protein
MGAVPLGSEVVDDMLAASRRRRGSFPACFLHSPAVMTTTTVRIQASLELAEDDPRASARPVLAIAGAFALALLVALTSLGGILLPTTYARETPNWAAQAVGQDWANLLVASPWLTISATLALRGSRRALLALGGVYAYFIYQFAIYAFAVHFNQFFLAYCAALGVSVFALVGLAAHVRRGDLTGPATGRGPVRVAGVFLIAVGALFAVAWLGEIVPAMATGAAPGALDETGLLTNPVHVLDLSVVLPLHVLAGVWLLRRKPAGHVLAAVVLGFGALMAASIAGLMIVMRQRGFEASWVALIGMAIISVLSATLLALLLRRLGSS